jgi:PAS domain S-box-containing protein
MLKTDNRQKSQVEGVAPETATAPVRPILDEIEVPAVVLENWQTTVDLLAQIANVPAALIMRVHPEEIEVFVASHGPGNVYQAGERSPLNMGLYCETVMGTRHELHVPNALKDPRWDRNPDIALGMISYGGLPLTWPNGEIFGTICILDREEHQHGLPTRQILERFADSIMLTLALIYESSTDVKQVKAERDFLIESSDDLICVAGVDGYVRSLNPAWERVLGYQHRDFLSRPLRDFVHPEDRQGTDVELARLAESGRALGFENRYVACDGSIRNILWTVTARPGEGLIYCIGKDITERKQVEAALHETQGLLQTAMDQSPAGIAIADAPSGKLRYVNDAGLLIRGGDRQSLVDGVGIEQYVANWQILDLDGNPLAADAVPLARAIRYGETNSREFIIRRSRNDDRVVVARAAPVTDTQGNVTSAVVVFLDVTESKRAEQASALSEARYRSLFDALMDGFVLLDMDGVVRESNEVYRKMVGYSAAELAQVTDRDLTPERWHPVEARIVAEQILPTGFSDVYEKEYRRKDGSIFPVELRTFLLKENERPVGMGAIVRDVTARKQTEAVTGHLHEQVQAEKDLLSALLESFDDEVWFCNTEGRFTLANRASLTAFQMDSGSGASVEKMAQSLEVLRPDGTPRPVEEAPPLRALRGEVVTRQEEIVRTPATGELRHRQVTATPVRDKGGRVIGSVSVVRDVTEAHALQAQMALASRLAALGTLVSGVAHEINNPLAAEMADQGIALEVVREVRERLLSHSPVDRPAEGRALDGVVEALEDAKKSGERIARIVKDLTLFGTPDAKRQPVRLMDIVDAAMRWLPSTVTRTASIQVENGGAPDVFACAGQVEQILVNLITNAARATPEGQRGKVLIRVGPGLPGMARVEVIDHGIGIAPAIRDRIFDPFFTSRPAGPARGTGLGLAICLAIATAHEGTLTVQSEVGKGSTFRVELPAAPAEA